MTGQRRVSAVGVLLVCLAAGCSGSDDEAGEAAAPSETVTVKPSTPAAGGCASWDQGYRPTQLREGRYLRDQADELMDAVVGLNVRTDEARVLVGQAGAMYRLADESSARGGGLDQLEAYLDAGDALDEAYDAAKAVCRY